MTKRVHPYRIHLYRDPKRRWRYRILAGNHRNVGASEQGFRTKRHARKRAVAALPADVLEANGGPGYTIDE